MNESPLRDGLLYDHGGAYALLLLDELSYNPKATIKWFFAALEVTSNPTNLQVNVRNYDATPENNRRLIEPLCLGIANLRHRNPNNPLLQLTFLGAKNVHHDVVDQFLVAAKQYGIQHVDFVDTSLTILSLVKFCRDNTHLKVLDFFDTCFATAVDASTVSLLPQDSSSILALDELLMRGAFFENAAAATEFLNWIAHVTYPALKLGKVAVEHDIDDVSDVEDVDYEEKKNARLRIVSALLKPSVEQLTLVRGCHTETIAAIAACTITQIQLDNADLEPVHFRDEDTKERLQTFATRNSELTRFVANPQDYPHTKLLKLMRQFDRSPTGRYMLACSFVGMPSFFKIKSTDTSTTGPKQKKPKDDSTEATNQKLMLENAQLRQQVLQVTGKLDQAMELLKAVAQQKQGESATLLAASQNGNEAQSAVGSWVLHDDASNNGAESESATSFPQAQVTGNATADETPPDQQ